MEFFTVRGQNYEEAVRKIQEKYGNYARIHSRKYVNRKRGFSRRTVREVEVSGYLVDEPGDIGAGIKDAHTSDTLDTLLHEVASLKKQLSSAPTESTGVSEDSIRSLLQDNEFSPAYITRILAGIAAEFPDGMPGDRLAVETRLLGLIADTIEIKTHTQRSFPAIFSLLGPTGVGKTTTIAKIAAQFGLDPNFAGKRNVTMITIDTYRIGARSQIETFGDIMSIPVLTADSPVSLDRHIRSRRESDLILIDTIGKSPKDQDIFDEMQRILSVCGSDTEFSLAVSASMKFRDILAAVERFRPLRISSMTVTKLDETAIIGNIVSAAHEARLPLLYLTTGQNVPQDLIRASRGFFMRHLQGFSVDVENIDFGSFQDESLHEPGSNRLFVADG